MPKTTTLHLWYPI